ncbi:MAG: UDP-N-acetylmuramate dehydrogenase [bacterium]
MLKNIIDIKEVLNKNNIPHLENANLSLYSTIKTGGFAELMIFPENETDIYIVCEIIKNYCSGFYVIGGGSNTLFKDEIINLPIISFKKGFKYINYNINTKENYCTVKAGAGVLLSKMLSFTIKNNFEGFEFVYGIPGTVGGAVKMNAGSKESNIENIINSLDIITKYGDKLNFKKNQLKFSYRNLEIPDINEDDYFIVGVEFLLKSSTEGRISEKIDLFKARKMTQPLGERSLGCIFKNPEGYSAGKIIDEIGCKGLSKGDAAVSEKHANFIINKGNAKSSDILDLINKIKETVLMEKNIKLNTEIKIK